jgi:hypothetical protein
MEIFYCQKPMPQELAASIRYLREQYDILYADLGFYLTETDPPFGFCVGLGKGLAELAEIYYSEDKKNAE